LKLVGATKTGEFLGRSPLDFSPPFQANGEPSEVAVSRHLARARSEGWDHFEWVARRIDGTLVPVEVTLTTLQLEGKTVIQSVIFDLTERKRAEEELQNALAKERELSQLKSDFVSLVSHEFRTPLEVIMSSVDNLDRYHDRLPVEKRSELLRTINKSVRRMAGMMEDVLLLGRFDSDGTEFKPAPLDLAAFCRRVRDEMDSATSRRCPIVLRFEGDFAGARGDEGVMRHILTNLLSNAVKYSPAGEAVDLSVSRDAAHGVIRITDRGCGIPEADQRRLFHAFHRGSNVRQIPGTGLGLLIVQRCVASHGGEITFESIEGQGTTFTVRLPLFAA
jgi:PAS domain S-box-containing protein